MIVRSLKDIAGTDREVSAENWTSRRLLLRDDGMGFSLHETIIRAGMSTEMHYQNHLEAVYCVGGRMSVQGVDTGEVFEVGDGTVYALDAHDRHVLTAETNLEG